MYCEEVDVECYARTICNANERKLVSTKWLSIVVCVVAQGLSVELINSIGVICAVSTYFVMGSIKFSFVF